MNDKARDAWEQFFRAADAAGQLDRVANAIGWALERAIAEQPERQLEAPGAAERDKS